MKLYYFVVYKIYIISNIRFYFRNLSYHLYFKNLMLLPTQRYEMEFSQNFDIYIFIYIDILKIT